MKTALYAMLDSQRIDAKFVVLCLLMPGGNIVLSLVLGRYLLRFVPALSIKNKKAA